MLCHSFWHGLFCFLVKPYLSTTYWEIKTRSCQWLSASEEMILPCPCCHQQPLLRHYFTSLLGSFLPLPKIYASLVWGHHSKPQTQRSHTPCYIMSVSYSLDIMPKFFIISSSLIGPWRLKLREINFTCWIPSTSKELKEVLEGQNTFLVPWNYTTLQSSLFFLFHHLTHSHCLLCQPRGQATLDLSQTHCHLVSLRKAKERHFLFTQ